MTKFPINVFLTVGVHECVCLGEIKNESFNKHVFESFGFKCLRCVCCCSAAMPFKEKKSLRIQYLYLFVGIKKTKPHFGLTWHTTKTVPWDETYFTSISAKPQKQCLGREETFKKKKKKTEGDWMNVLSVTVITG